MSSPSEWTQSFPDVPANYVGELFGAFSEQVEAWYVHDWEKVGLKAGKICEISHSIIKAVAGGVFPPNPSKPSNFLTANTQIENLHPTLPRSLRIQIPRVMIGVYELRNNRSVGHVGGAVSPNQLDGEFFFRSTKWIVCELSRSLCELKGVRGDEGFYNEVNMSELPIIWEQGDMLRVLRPELNAGEKSILVLSHYGAWGDAERLRKIVEYKNASNFRQKVLGKLHDEKLIEFDSDLKRAMILPPGLRRARKLHS